MARLDDALYRNSSRFFVAFLVFVVWAFWPSYFARLFEQPNVRFHAHGVALTLWCAMLVVQAQLVKTNRRRLHKQLGKASYVLAPALQQCTAQIPQSNMLWSVLESVRHLRYLMLPKLLMLGR